MNIPTVFWLVPIASLVALGMAWFFFKNMMKADEGTPRMREIALYVRKGAMAYLKQQYKVVCWLGRILWNEDRHLCFCPYGQRSPSKHGRRTEDRLP